MKWFCFVVVVFVGMNLLFPSAAFTELEKPVEIKSIVHTKISEVNETITFTLDKSVAPKLLTFGGAKPRLVIDFPESIYLGKNVISLADGVLASAIRIGLHNIPVRKTRVVVDLSKEIPVRYASEYSELDKKLTLTLTADLKKLKAETAVELKSQSQSTSPDQKKHSGRPVDQKNVTPETSMSEVAVAPASEKAIISELPTILDISFDDSSSKGEMVLFRLNKFSPPIVSVIEKENPRVLCDFMETNMNPSVLKSIEANGKYIERIRAARHDDPKKVRVVLDLLPNRDYDLQQVFFRNDNLFVLIVNELSPDQGAQ